MIFVWISFDLSISVGDFTCKKLGDILAFAKILDCGIDCYI